MGRGIEAPQVRHYNQYASIKPYQVMSMHGNPREDAFQHVSIKEQAYWLGLLYADGCVFKEKSGLRMGISVGIKDEWIIDKIIEFLCMDKGIKNIHRNGTQVRIRIQNKRITTDLIKYGCVPRKSKIIELPKLDSRELYLAFLLGFFDGDGKQGTTRITCGSLKFFEQIKEMFHLSFKIQEKTSNGFIEGNRIISGKGYDMCLGAELFNEMMENYEGSLPRKRKHFYTNVEKIAIHKTNAWHNHHEKKFDVPRHELERLVWEMPLIKVAIRYGVSDSTIAKRCKQFGIQKPGRGYW